MYKNFCIIASDAKLKLISLQEGDISNLVVFILAVALGWYVFADNPAKHIVYDVCQESRINDSISESTCGELQDKYHIEYLCKANNNLESNVCWVEEKK